jgi:hypothetical protein
VRAELANSPLLPLLELTVTQATNGTSLDDFLATQNLDRGVSGYINHTVAASIFCWIRRPHDYRQAVETVVAPAEIPILLAPSSADSSVPPPASMPFPLIGAPACSNGPVPTRGCSASGNPWPIRRIYFQTASAQSPYSGPRFPSAISSF